MAFYYIYIYIEREGERDRDRDHQHGTRLASGKNSNLRSRESLIDRANI